MQIPFPLLLKDILGCFFKKIKAEQKSTLGLWVYQCYFKVQESLVPMTPSSPAIGREALDTEVSIYNSIDSEIQTSKPSQLRQPQVLDCAKKIMKCNGLWALWWCVLRSQDRYFWGSLVRVSQSSLMMQCCSFILSPGNCHLIGKGSRLHTISNTVKDKVKKNLRTKSQTSWDDQILLVSLTQGSQATSLSLSFLRWKWRDFMIPKDLSSP